MGLGRRVPSRPLIALRAGAAGFVVSVIAFAVTFETFKLMIGDCAPGQQDGQCGLGTFLSLLCSFPVSLLVWIVATYKFFRRFAKPSPEAEF